MLLDKTKKNRGQVGDTVTWVVATIVIIVLIIIFVFASSILAKTYKVISLVDFDFGDSEKKVNFIFEKNSFAFEKDNSNQILIKQWLEGK